MKHSLYSPDLSPTNYHFFKHVGVVLIPSVVLSIERLSSSYGSSKKPVYGNTRDGKEA